MKVHLIINPDNEIFGVFKDGQLMKEGWILSAVEILESLGIEAHLIFYNEDDMKRLPQNVGEIPITEILKENAY